MIRFRPLTKYARVFVIFYLALIFSPQIFSQQLNDPIISRDYNNLPWNTFVEQLEKDFHFKFYYEPGAHLNISIQVPNDTITLKQLLTDNLRHLGINVAIDKKGNVFLTRKLEIITKLPDDFFEAVTYLEDTLNAQEEREKVFLKTSKEYIVKTLIVGARENGINKRNATVSGFIKNENTGEPIIGGTLYFEELGTGVASNTQGYFNITLRKGNYTLVVRSLNCEEEKYRLQVLSDGEIDLFLREKSFMLKGVEITSGRIHNVRSTMMGVEKITTEAIKEIPIVFGESDIIKVALLLPGIQTVGEGSAGINVRGSPADQNLFYINNVPIYNTSHLSGFFSAFNSDAISDFTLLKSNIPAKYGGRLASIFDISAKTGNKNKTTVKGGISTITGRILVEGPIQKEKSTDTKAVNGLYQNIA